MDIAIKAATDDRGRSVLAVAGSIDLQTREHLLASGRTAIEGDAAALVLDLEDVTFIDSTGIGALIELGHEASDDGGGGLVIRNPSARVVRILEISGLADAWAMESSE